MGHSFLARLVHAVIALLCLRPAVRGVLDLDSPLSLLLPDLAIQQIEDATRPITIRDLMAHHSGLPSDDFAKIKGDYIGEYLGLIRIRETAFGRCISLKGIELGIRPLSDGSFDPTFLGDRVPGLPGYSFRVEDVGGIRDSRSSPAPASTTTTPCSPSPNTLSERLSTLGNLPGTGMKIHCPGKLPRRGTSGASCGILTAWTLSCWLPCISRPKETTWSGVRTSTLLAAGARGKLGRL